MEYPTKLRAAVFGWSALAGALLALFTHQPPQWEALQPGRPRPAAAAAEPSAAPRPAAAPANPELTDRVEAFPAVRERVIVLGQELRRVEGQIERQRQAYEKFVRASLPFDLDTWHHRQKELAQEHAELEVELALANAEYERYICRDGRPRADCWH